MTDNIKNGNGRLAAYRGEAREILRERIKAEEALEKIELAENILADEYDMLSAPAVGALNALLASKWKRMAKVLPDIKAVEHDPGERTERLARDQLNVRIAELHERANSRIDGRGSAGALPAVDGSDTTH